MYVVAKHRSLSEVPRVNYSNIDGGYRTITKMTERVRETALFSALLWTFLAGGKSKTIVPPIDIEVRVGDSTYLNCSISDPSAEVSWYHYQADAGSKEQRFVYYKDQLFAPYDKRFMIEKDTSTGSCNLIITKAELEDAGVYVCHDSGSDKSAIVHLTVLGLEISCRINNTKAGGFIGPNDCYIQPDTVTVLCSTSYKGNIPPTFQLARVKSGRTSIIKDSLKNHWESGPTDGIVYEHTFDNDIDLDGSHFVCQTTKSRKANYSCSTEAIQILYAVGHETPITRTIGDRLNCSAHTNIPNCQYQWTSFGINDTISKNSSEMISRNGLHECKARCIVRDIECTFTAMVVIALPESVVVPGKHNEPITHGGWIFGSIVPLIGVFVAIATVLCLRRGRQKRRPRRSD